jgi:hypothetical protein
MKIAELFESILGIYGILKRLQSARRLRRVDGINPKIRLF